jgi:hypothetical protein
MLPYNNGTSATDGRINAVVPHPGVVTDYPEGAITLEVDGPPPEPGSITVRLVFTVEQLDAHIDNCKAARDALLDL